MRISALFQILNTHGLHEYDACYKEKYFAKTIFADRTGILAKHAEKRGRNKVDSHEAPLRIDREG